MNNRAVIFIRNFSYALTSNLVTLVISILVILIVPKLIGVEEYGYWQLYLFYTSFVGFMHFGWNDGIYLRYGGKSYKELDKSLFFSQFYMLVILQILIAILIIGLGVLLSKDPNKIYIVQMTAVCMIILNVRYMPIYILQGTNKIKEYAQINIIDRFLYILIILIFLIIGIRDYRLLIVADLLGRFISLSYAIYCCREIVFRRFSNFYFSFREVFENISVGIKLMYANIASMLIIGIVRFGIERSWDVVTFGKVSLTLSISSLMMFFINAVGIVLFPILRRMDENKLPNIYVTIRDFLMILLLGFLIVFYPLKVALSAWLPQYAESMMYMAILFPICVYEGKMALLINTYLKTLRKETLILKINLISLCISVLVTILTTLILNNLNLTILSIVILLAFKCILAEFMLSKILQINLYRDVVIELTITIIFIFTNWFINSWLAVMLYVVSYLMYLTIKKKDITKAIKNINFLLKVKEDKLKYTKS